MESKFPPLVFTKNNLVDVIKFINDNNVVVIHNANNRRIFHLNSLNLDSPDPLKDTRVIYVDCGSLPGLVDEGEWEWYIKSSNENILEASREKFAKIAIPNGTHISI